MNEITVKTASGDSINVKTPDQPHDALAFLQELFPQMQFEPEILKGAA